MRSHLTEKLLFGLTSSAMAIVLNSCGGSAGIFNNGPADVTKALYMACNAGEYSKADELLSADMRKLAHGELAAASGGLQRMCDSNTHNGTIVSVDIKKETVRGDGAVVLADIHFKDGNTKVDDDTTLIKENGAWKVSH